MLAGPGLRLALRANVAALGHALWVSRFAGDPAVADGSHVLSVDGESLPIVGVLAADFDLPGGAPDFFVPAQLDRSRYTNRSGHNLNALARRWWRCSTRPPHEPTSPVRARSGVASVCSSPKRTGHS